MAEGVGCDPPAEGPHDRLVGDRAQRDDCPQIRKAGDGGHEEAPASVDFRADGLVLWRHATNRIGDGGPDQFKAVIGPRFEFATGEAEAFQRGIEKVAGIVAGERAAGAVRAT
jgi:hypothetical protein